ncbi:Eukaryotic translation initiation factor 2 subunit 2 [Amphibalanus amphitrite]|uniref:Eukaryotic translation initiation factor 2 subunit 2 n=1 Tax=Amphibalanus amphitrite TaxID=1232801 RepID=A0A6A4WB32_AMPAM|nr:Eukaryotic translation initiation factor 2 subunit 2 [Amphibalanus amphitrite]
MAEEEALDIFDASKKKKKKKKTPFDIDAALGEGGGTSASAASAAETASAADTAAGSSSQDAAPSSSYAIDDDINLDLETFGKKKKKKKMPLNLDELGDALPVAEPKPEVVEEAAEDLDLDLDMDFSKSKKKKKKKKDIEELVAGDDAENEEPADQDGTDWAGTDRDYTYDELLTRVFDIMREKNPDMVAGEKRKFVMRPPQVVRLGAKKSSFVNFADICKMLHRQPQHLLNFLFAELGTSGSVDGTNQLIIKGRFQQKQIETVLRRYIREYVTCHTCRSPDTILQKDTRLFFLQCESCGSRCTVASIKSGFQAVTGKRSVLRAKAS